MKITKLETFLVNADWRNWVFVKIYTDAGITGVGEATCEGRELATAATIKELESYVLGKDPYNVEQLWLDMFYKPFLRGGAIINSAISGIEIALWDIIGESLNVPVYKLLGGICHPAIRLYATIYPWVSLEELARTIEKVKSKGFTGVKFDPFSREAYQLITRKEERKAVERVKMVREVGGEDLEIMVECHGRLNPVSAIRIAKALEPYDLLFIEEPIPPDNIEAMSKIASRITIPIATGERLYTRYGFRELLEKQLASFIQPDVIHAGGILETKKISAMAEIWHVLVAPHNPNGPVATAASVQLATCIPNFHILEFPDHEVPWRDEIVKEPLKISGGSIELPTRSGIGVELDEKIIKKYPYKVPDFHVFD